MSKLQALQVFAQDPFGIVQVAAGLASPVIKLAPGGMNPVINVCTDHTNEAVEVQLHILRALYGEGLPPILMEPCNMDMAVKEIEERGMRPVHTGLLKEEIRHRLEQMEDKSFTIFNWSEEAIPGAHNFSADMLRLTDEKLMNRLGVMTIEGEPLVWGWLDKVKKESIHWHSESLEDFLVNCLMSFGEHTDTDFNIITFRKSWNLST